MITQIIPPNSLKKIILTLIALALLSPAYSQGIGLYFLDKYTEIPIPFVQLEICENLYQSDENGYIQLFEPAAVCDYTVFAFGYVPMKGTLGLKDKNQLTILIEPKTIELSEFKVHAEKITFKNAKEIVALAIENFPETHKLDSKTLVVFDSASFMIGNESFYRQTHKAKIDSLFYLNKNHEQGTKILKPSKFKSLEKLISIENKIIEYRYERTDFINKQDCNYGNDLACYFHTFYSTERALMLNPYFFRPKRSKSRDHFGFFNQDFVTTHNFKLLGVEQSNGHECYLIEISSNRKSFPISLAKNEIDWYKPSGKIWIDRKDFALVKLSYTYAFDSKPGFLSPPVDKAEYASGSIYYENILDFKKSENTYYPVRQYTREKDRTLRLFYTDVFFEPVYSTHFIRFERSQ